MRPIRRRLSSCGPKGAPGGEKVTVVETVTPRPPPPGMRDRIREHTRAPSLTVFRPDKPNGAAVILAPGGAFVRTTMDKEGYETARFLASRGYCCFVLAYRFLGDGWAAGQDVGLQDAQRATRLVRANAAKYQVDPNRIVMQGFSAGMAMWRQAPSPALTNRSMRRWTRPIGSRRAASSDLEARLTYAVSDGPVGDHAGQGRDAGGDPPQLGHRPCYGQRATPPTILFHAQDDPSVPVEGSVAMFTALRAAKVKVEMHIFEQGKHGWGLRGAEGLPAAEWPTLFVSWMKSHGC